MRMDMRYVFFFNNVVNRKKKWQRKFTSLIGYKVNRDIQFMKFFG